MVSIFNKLLRINKLNKDKQTMYKIYNKINNRLFKLEKVMNDVGYLFIIFIFNGLFILLSIIILYSDYGLYIIPIMGLYFLYCISPK